MLSVMPYCWSSGLSKENRLASEPAFGGEAKALRGSMATTGGRKGSGSYSRGRGEGRRHLLRHPSLVVEESVDPRALAGCRGLRFEGEFGVQTGLGVCCLRTRRRGRCHSLTRSPRP
jgi:hypothetical protein